MPDYSLFVILLESFHSSLHVEFTAIIRKKQPHFAIILKKVETGSKNIVKLC